VSQKLEKSLSDEERRDQEGSHKLPGGQEMKVSDFQVGNEMRSVDLIDCQEGRRNPNFPGGKGRGERLSESLMNSERVHIIKEC
jgi:hypothetical protein